MFKMRLLFFFFIFCFIAIIVKLFYLQVVLSANYVADYIRTQKIAPERGRIFDRNVQPLATNQTTFLLYVEPQKMRDKKELVKKIDEILQIGEATVESRIDEKKQWVAVKGGITDEVRQKLKALDLPEIGFQNESRRFYPEASLSAHIIGFVGKNADGDNTGYFGLEGFYDKDLAGLPGVIKSERDLLGRPMFVGTQDMVQAENGRDLILTIDKTVQLIVKTRLQEGMAKYQPKEGCAIAADPMTMEILALTCLPDYDPEIYTKYTEQDFNNPAIASLYEPGSTFKPLIMAAALEEKVVKPDDFFDEEGPVKIGEAKIDNWDFKHDGKITMTRILEKSSNLGMVYLGTKLGPKKEYEYMQKYGIGTPTGIDLQGEVGGFLRPEKDWYPLDYAAGTFGQGIVVTPLQLVRGFAAVINGGYLLRPYIVKEVVDGGVHRTREPKIEKRVLSQKTSDMVKKMLVSTVENGEVHYDRPKGYTVGGKTGTAQVAIQGNYDASKTIASFIGFAPADKPKFLILVVLKEPKTSSWGSETAAPLFFQMAKDLFIYYSIPPEG